MLSWKTIVSPKTVVVLADGNVVIVGGRNLSNYHIVYKLKIECRIIEKS